MAEEREFWEQEWRENAPLAGVPDRFLEEALAGLEPGRALDLGCGDGTNALLLAAKGWRVTGIDLAAPAVELAVAAASRAGLAAEFVVADATAWTPPGLYDLVLSAYALPGGEGTAKVLTTAAASLAPGGILLVLDWDRAMAAVWDFPPEDLPTPAEIAAALPSLAIEAAEVRTMTGFAPDDPRGAHGEDAKVAFVRARRI